MGAAGKKARPEGHERGVTPRVEDGCTEEAEEQLRAGAPTPSTAETMPTETAREEAAAAGITRQERIAGGADRPPVAGQQVSAEEGGRYGTTLRAREGLGGSAHEEIDKSDPGGARGRCLPRSQPGQRQLGVGLAPARPGPLAGWERQDDPSHDAAGGDDGACPSSSRRQEPRTEITDVLRPQISDDDHDEEEARAAVTAERRQRAGMMRKRTLQEQAERRAMTSQAQDTAGRTEEQGGDVDRDEGGTRGGWTGLDRWANHKASRQMGLPAKSGHQLKSWKMVTRGSG
ncbi:unnamed protein product [Closterium sp. NIES-64]|nr:unnamed protein product [Closterium sp. NIES-65]CAI5965605.1 unnamed protein product [Closterium sp. NIES-64]